VEKFDTPVPPSPSQFKKTSLHGKPEKACLAFCCMGVKNKAVSGVPAKIWKSCPNPPVKKRKKKTQSKTNAVGRNNKKREKETLRFPFFHYKKLGLKAERPAPNVQPGGPATAKPRPNRKGGGDPSPQNVGKERGGGIGPHLNRDPAEKGPTWQHRGKKARKSIPHEQGKNTTGN